MHQKSHLKLASSFAEAYSMEPLLSAIQNLYPVQQKIHRRMYLSTSRATRLPSTAIIESPREIHADRYSWSNGRRVHQVRRAEGEVSMAVFLQETSTCPFAHCWISVAIEVLHVGWRDCGLQGDHTLFYRVPRNKYSNSTSPRFYICMRALISTPINPMSLANSIRHQRPPTSKISRRISMACSPQMHQQLELPACGSAPPQGSSNPSHCGLVLSPAARGCPCTNRQINNVIHRFKRWRWTPHLPA